MHRHLCSTINDELYLWRPIADPKLPTAQLLTLCKDDHIIKTPDSSNFEPVSFADADWAANLNYIRSVSGTAVFLSGAPINCKRKLQYAVALSSP